MLKFVWHIVVLLSLHASGLSAQIDGGDKVVTLTVSGQGDTPDEARQSALRNAIEQAFGTFISSHTEILNDQLVKEEIVSVSNGNIQAFEVLSELEIPGGGYASTLKATVSISRLTSFVESKGVAVEFKGALFAMNIKQQLLNEESELKAMTELADVLKQISDKSFDYYISAGEPTANGQVWNVPLTVTVKPNANLKLIPEHLSKVLAGLTMNADEVDNYKKLNKPYFSIAIRSDQNVKRETSPPSKEKKSKTTSVLSNPNPSEYKLYALRSERSINALCGAIGYFAHSLQAFIIDDGISIRSLQQLDSASSSYSFEHQYIQSIADWFRPVIVGNFYELGSWSLIRQGGGGGKASNLLSYEKGIDRRLNYLNTRGDKLLHDLEIIPLEHDLSFKIKLAMRKTGGEINAYNLRNEIKLVPPIVPGDLFPDLGPLVDAWGEKGIVLQFQKLTDAHGIAVTYNIVDIKTLLEIQRVSGYTIRSTDE